MQQEPDASQADAKYGFRARTSGNYKEMACGKRQRNGQEAILGTAGAIAKNIQDDLLVSFDGAAVYRPWRERRQCRTKGGWYHVDQNYWNVGRQGFACVQGMVTLTDVHEGTGGLVLIPGSHKKFKKLSKLKRVKDEYEDRSEDYVRFEKTDLDRVLAKRKMVPSLVRVRAGDMILWDSRVVHSGAPGWFSGQGGAGKKVRKVGGTTFPELAHQWLESQTQLLRMAAYICMMPARRIPPHRLDHVLDVRQRIFKRGWATTHWPLEPTLGAKEEKPKVEAEAPANEVQRRLIGFR